MTKDKNEKRDHMIHVHIKNSIVTACDGKRIHSYQSKNKFADGFYKVIKYNKSHIFLKSEGTDKTYPEFKDILKPADIQSFSIHEPTSGYAKIIRTLNKAILNYTFLCDLLTTDNSFNCFIINDKAPIIFTSKNKKAAIMPMKPQS